MPFVEFKDINKVYDMGEVKVNALSNFNLAFEEGELVVIVGPSGSGKTTLLNLLGGMDTATSGDIFLNGRNITRYSEHEMTLYRRHDIGFVFQFYNLVQNLTALENVELATQICDEPLDPKTTLEEVGLGDRLKLFPSQLSGGEQQRVSIARAIAKNPQLLLCDEPTGALDYETGKQVLGILQGLARDKNKTVVIITHNSVITEMADRVVKIREGAAVSSEINKKPKSAEKLEW
ncbi:MAG: ABC transporter ATP-binding protein [Coriobacteriia bacterium]|nr:ABC transporter ATP-binding protein [Coriobacteriia bacterium]